MSAIADIASEVVLTSAKYAGWPIVCVLVAIGDGWIAMIWLIEYVIRRTRKI